MVEYEGKTWLLYHVLPAGAEGSTPSGRRLWLDEVMWDGDSPVVQGHRPAGYSGTIPRSLSSQTMGSRTRNGWTPDRFTWPVL